MNDALLFVATCIRRFRLLNGDNDEDVDNEDELDTTEGGCITGRSLSTAMETINTYVQ
jgi:hypothetical protein